MRQAENEFNHLQRIRAAGEFENWMVGFEFTNFITFNFNSHTTPTAAKMSLKRWHMKTDRKLYGCNYHRLHANERTFFFAWMENTTTNIHYHALVRSKDKDFYRVGKKIWGQVVPSGQWFDGRRDGGRMSSHEIFNFLIADESPCLSEADKRGIAGYITKQGHLPIQNENFVISTEFSSHH